MADDITRYQALAVRLDAIASRADAAEKNLVATLEQSVARMDAR